MDEALVLYKGWSSLKQYMPTKHVRRGLKVWIRADAVSGFVSHVQVHVGKDGSAEMGLGAQVIKKLTRTYVKKKYHVICDFFLSVNLSTVMALLACLQLEPSELTDYLCMAGQQANHSMLYILSTNTSSIIERKMNNGKKKTFPCHRIITSYNRYMGAWIRMIN
uniref:PiggyBac transposable element-derived protein domain-containing protein n=1 Tax=Amphimedon queenslandica TaxID=400682 RepID=A0A1X7SWL7_AMPQE